MRLAIRLTILLAAALVPGLAGCGDPPAAPTRAIVRPMPLPSATVDSTQCLSGYSVSNGVVTCNEPG